MGRPQQRGEVREQCRDDHQGHKRPEVLVRKDLPDDQWMLKWEHLQSRKEHLVAPGYHAGPTLDLALFRVGDGMAGTRARRIDHAVALLEDAQRDKEIVINRRW